MSQTFLPQYLRDQSNFLPRYMQFPNRLTFPTWRPKQGPLKVAVGAAEDIRKLCCGPDGPWHFAFVTEICFHPFSSEGVELINPATGESLL